MKIYTGMSRLNGNHHGRWDGSVGETLRSTVRLFALGDGRIGTRTSFGARLYFYKADGSNVSFDLGIRWKKPLTFARVLVGCSSLSALAGFAVAKFIF